VFGKLIRVKLTQVELSENRIESFTTTLHQKQLQQNKNTNMVLIYQKDWSRIIELPNRIHIEN
jgi:hypothetical protein